MLTFEKVLAAFKDYLEEDDCCTVLMTPRGYTILEWDDSCQNWVEAEFCATPEVMRDLLLADLACHLKNKITSCERPLKDDEWEKVQQQLNEIAALLQ